MDDEKADLEMPYNVTKQPFFLSSEIWTEASMVSNILLENKQKMDVFDVLPYVENIESIAIIVNCFPDEMLRDGWGKPRKYISYQKKYADIRLPIPYDSFVHADYETEYRMVVDNIVQSIRVIDEKCRKSKRAKCDSEGLIEVLLQRLEMSQEQLQDVVGVLSEEAYRKIMEAAR